VATHMHVLYPEKAKGLRNTKGINFLNLTHLVGHDMYKLIMSFRPYTQSKRDPFGRKYLVLCGNSTNLNPHIH